MPQLLRIAGVIACVVVFSVAYVLGQNQQNKRQKNMQVRLELVKDRFKHCDAERRLLRGEGKRTDEDDLRIAMQEQAALVSENQLLTEDNEKLREEIQELEDQVDELRESLNDKDFVTDDEVAQLQATMDLGNNSQALQEVLSEAQMSFGVSKDDLIAKLLAELQRKRTALRGCKRKLGAETGKPEETNDAKAGEKKE